MALFECFVPDQPPFRIEMHLNRRLVIVIDNLQDAINVIRILYQATRLLQSKLQEDAEKTLLEVEEFLKDKK